MSFATANPAQSYATIGIETGVAGASPHQLILMLYEGALLAIAKANACIEQHDIAGKGKAISQAIDIINSGLRSSLNFAEGGELAGRLAALYEYMAGRLLHAMVHDDQAALREVSQLLGEIKSAWEEIADDPAVVSASGKRA